MPMTFDQATVDGTGAFLVHELERLDQTLNLPLVNFTWSRDIQLREDVSIADEISSFTNTTFAAAGTPNANGKNWLSKIPTALAGVNVDIVKTGFPLTLWGMELGWTVPELQAAAQVGRPIDTQKYDGMQLKWNMDTDEQVYTGDSGLNVKGLLNLTQVTPTNAAKTWATSTADEIRNSINAGLSSAWANSAYSMVPTDMLIPPEQFALLANTIVSSAGGETEWSPDTGEAVKTDTSVAIGWSYAEGVFSAPPVPQPSRAELVASAEQEQSSLLEIATAKIVIWQTKLLAGRKLTTSETTQLNAWLDYIDAVTAVDTSTAPDIDWPVAPGGE